MAVIGSADPPVIWRTKLRSLKPGVNHAKQFAYCVDGGRVGIGWGIEKLPTGTSLAEVVAAIHATELPGWGRRAASTVRLFGEEAAVGDFVWTRDLEGRFRLGRIAGGYRYENSAKAEAMDIHQVRKTDWADQPLGDLEVPVAIIRAFSGTSTSFSRMWDPGARLYTRWLWEKLHGREPPPLDFSLAEVLKQSSQSEGRAREAAGGVDRWWTVVPAERFWLEVSGRETFGRDLRAPDDARTSHALVREVKLGDLIFHYSKRSRSIVGWSEVVGPPRHVENEYRVELGGMLGFMRVDLARLRDFDTAIRQTASEMSDRGYALRGFPFERSKTRRVRPLPAYLSKLPLRIVATIPELAAAVSLSPGAPLRRLPGQGREVGGAYRSANEGVTIPAIISQESEAWRIEQAAQRTERSTREHHRLQNRLARYLRDHGMPTLSPQGDDVAFDLAWRAGNGLAFAEVKSLPQDHASQRLRLGLGQCLFYRHALQTRLMKSVAACLVVPREPDDPAWLGACADVGVILVWPTRFAELLTEAGT
ncbi:MAG: hypothetical protein ACRDLF_05540 [Solirubrobacteraceae bacterium]